MTPQDSSPVTPPAAEPPKHLADPRELLEAYLDYYRETIVRKVSGLSEEEMRSSRVPSGWTPLGLVVHLIWVERRWFEWGFAAMPFENPWGDRGPDDSWAAPEDVTAEQVVTDLRAQRERSLRAVGGAPLDRRAALGGRFATEAEAPTLAWIFFHVLQEYARHAGHLDIGRELADGAIGE